MSPWIVLDQKDKKTGEIFSAYISIRQIIFCQFWDKEKKDKGYGEIVVPGGCFYVWSKEEMKQVESQLGIL